VIEEGTRKRDLGEDPADQQSFSKGSSLDVHLQILDSLAVLLKLHRTTIVDKHHDVKQRDLDEIGGQLEREFPSGSEGLKRSALDHSLSDGLKSLWRGVERLQVLLRSAQVCQDIGSGSFEGKRG